MSVEALPYKEYSIDIGDNTQWRNSVIKQRKCLTKFDLQIENMNMAIFTAKYHIRNGNKSRSVSENGEKSWDTILETSELRLKDINSNIKHSEYLCKLFQCYVRAEVPKQKIILNIIKSNALDVEYYLRECCEQGLCSEEHYKNRAEGLMAELKSFEDINEIFRKADKIEGADPTYTA
tara:strand:+ start:47 stop:580 length:534 start_codon:yes stop_codon:yes gene_type:complete